MPNKKLYNPQFSERGYIQLYIGRGKFKTSAALGLAVRAIGHGWKVAHVLFTKGKDEIDPGFYGEVNSIKKYFPKKVWIVEQFGQPKVLYKKDLDQNIIEELNEGFEYASNIINSGVYGLVVLDEINICIDLEIFTVEQIKNLLENKPKHVEIVMTGRLTKYRKEIVKMAHLVTEGIPVKHYWNIGIPARKGIER